MWTRTRLAALAALVAAATISGIPSEATPATAPTLAWADCGDGFECAAATLPLDHDRPRGATIVVPLIRKPATVPADRIGSLFLNPGGPGGSGIAFLRAISGAFAELDALNERFDLVSFDPRGVGAAEPAVRCQTSAEIDALLADLPDVTRDPLGRVLDEAAAYARECRRGNDRILRHMSFADVARDLDLLRKAVGDERLSYPGFSAGTELGAQYVTLFPGRARAVVLDSAIDHDLYMRDPFDRDLGVVRASERNFAAFFAFCAANPVLCPFGGGDPARAYDALLARYDAQPVPLGGRLVDDTLLRIGTFVAMSSASRFFPILGFALAQADAGDPSLIASLADALAGRLPDGSYTNFLDANFVTQSNSTRLPRRADAYARFASDTLSASPHFGRLFAALDARRRALPLGADAYRGPVKNPPDAAPVLIVAATGDDETPYAEGVALRAQLGNAGLLTLDALEHGSYLASACIRQHANAYLIGGVLPPVGTVCR